MKQLFANSKTPIKPLIAFLLLLSIFSKNTLAQDCTVNAGGNTTICGSTITLTGSVGGNFVPPLSWAFVSGPVTPTIVTANSLTTTVTGMVLDGIYVFQLTYPCSSGISTSTVGITAHPLPASFTAGPDITGICAITGTANLAGVIPSGFTGTWSAANIEWNTAYGTNNTTNSSISNVNSATLITYIHLITYT